MRKRHIAPARARFFSDVRIVRTFYPDVPVRFVSRMQHCGEFSPPATDRRGVRTWTCRHCGTQQTKTIR